MTDKISFSLLCRPNVITLQAITEDERTQWMLSMGGKEPVSTIINCCENMFQKLQTMSFLKLYPSYHFESNSIFINYLVNYIFK